MDKIQFHELAIAYAQARLSRKQDNSLKPASKDELYDFVHDYLFAMEHIKDQAKLYPR